MKHLAVTKPFGVARIQVEKKDILSYCLLPPKSYPYDPYHTLVIVVRIQSKPKIVQIASYILQ